MKRKKVSPFLLGYLFFLLTCVTFWAFVVASVYECLIRYEAAQPEHVVEGLIDQIRRDGVDSVFPAGSPPTRFETEDFIAAYQEERIQGKTLSWRQDKSSYNVTSPVYQIYADEELLGVVSLREVSSEPLMFILSLSEWAVDSAELAAAEGQESITVTVPEGCSVLLNDVPMGVKELTGNVQIPGQFRYAQDYVAVPKLVEYQVMGLLEKPSVKVLDASGKPVEYEEVSKEGHTAITADSFPVSEMDGQLASQVLENAERYTNFFSADLPGCRASTKPIADMFPEDSYYLTLAETYRREDMWMYNEHGTPSFTDESVTNYIRYSEELFSCEVFFEKHIPLTKGNSTRIDTTHMCCIYGYLDGAWKILDMQTILD